MNYEFPKGFWWGSGASGPQTEGTVAGDGKGQNIWDYWYPEKPDVFFNGIGLGNASSVYNRNKEDIALMKN